MTSEDRENFWRFWSAYFKPLGIEPYLEEVDIQTKTRPATEFSGHVQKGIHGRGKQIQVGTVCEALVGVNTNTYLEKWRQPLHQPGSNENYILPLQHMLKGLENKEPPRVKKLAVHPDFSDWICKWGHRKVR